MFQFQYFAWMCINLTCKVYNVWLFCSAREKYVRRAWEKAEVSEKWAQSSWAKKIEAREKVNIDFCHQTG